LKINWKKWKGKGKKRLERIDKEKIKEGRIKEWDKEDEMEKMGDIYDEL